MPRFQIIKRQRGFRGGAIGLSLKERERTVSARASRVTPALFELFKMITADGPVPEIDQGPFDRAS